MPGWLAESNFFFSKALITFATPSMRISSVSGTNADEIYFIRRASHTKNPPTKWYICATKLNESFFSVRCF